MKAFVL